MLSTRRRRFPAVLLWMPLFALLCYFLPVGTEAAGHRAEGGRRAQGTAVTQQKQKKSERAPERRTASGKKPQSSPVRSRENKRSSANKGTQSRGKKTETAYGRVVRVVDGDTFTISRDGGRKDRYEKVRILGIDAPERSQAWGPEAGRRLSQLIHSQRVKLEITGYDRYGRIVAKVWCGGSDVGLEMIRSGLAWHYRQYYESDEYAAAEVEARSRRAGLWREENPVEPRQYRKHKQ